MKYYMQRIRCSIRWLHNKKQRVDKDSEPIEPFDWTTTLSFVIIKEKKSKRISPCLESEIWAVEEL